ncbi:hypothetical protein [Candidatus Nitrospira bockiana]
MADSLSAFRLALVLAMVGAVACAPTKVTTVSSPGVQEHRVRSVVVLPFERLVTPQVLDSRDPEFSVPRGAKASDINILVPPPMADTFDRETATVPPFVPEKIARIFSRKLEALTGLTVIGPDEARAAIKRLGGIPSDTPDRLAAQVAKAVGADAAVVGRALIYKEREGTRWGADPAIVGFEVQLIAPEGQRLWSGNYYERQRPLVEDLVGFWQHGGGFVTAEQLVEYGAERLAEEFPYRAR